MTEYANEEIFEVIWHGPYTLESLEKDIADYPGFGETLCLYAKYEDHPLYGRKALTYIGKSIEQSTFQRLSQHASENDMLYVANIRTFKNWSDSDALDKKEEFLVSDYIRSGNKNKRRISRIEELLIYALWPAGNTRNKNTASKSWGYRLFNTGDLGALPPEISGHYTLFNAPKRTEDS